MKPVAVTRFGNYVLGLEIGVTSLGWAALELNAEGVPTSILAVGARKFPTGTIGDIDSGRDASRNADRQQARGRRGRLAQRIQRLRLVWQLLQGAGLLPSGSFKGRDVVLKALDVATGQTPYTLRARALDGALSPHELGRALYHIAQRRGFQSNRRAPPKDDEELGVVKKGIADLEEAIRASGARTLGEYLSKAQGPLRRRWTARQMYRDEVALILAAQAVHHPSLTERFGKRLQLALFAQRKLRSQAHRIGRCDLEPSRRRTQMAGLDAQEFRMLARVNDLRLVDDVGAEPVDLTVEQRRTLIELLGHGDAKFTSIRKALKLPATVRFNAERIDEKTLIGLRTDERLRSAMGALWDEMPRERRSALVDDLLNIDDEAGLRRRLLTTWAFAEPVVAKLVGTQLEPSYASLSHKAIARLLPALRLGTPYATARKSMYPYGDHHEICKRLPMVQTVYRQLANPLVSRALSEVRAVVNALIAAHGVPVSIRVSLMRQLRMGRKSRERASFHMRKRQKIRAAASERVLKDLGVQEPSHAMIDKVLLAEECGWVCPYTGKAISMRSLVGGDPRYVVSHILPFYKSLDDSFENKVLCHVGLTVDPKALRAVDEQVIGRFRRFIGPYAGEKLRRLLMSDDDVAAHCSERAIASHFVDACYASRLAVDYLSRLYPPNKASVQAVRGPVVRYVKEACGLGRIDVPRGSYKRHAVDAAAVAVCGPSIVRTLHAAALAALPGGRRLSAEVVLPWPTFARDLGNAAADVVISTRIDRRARGPLHEETFYRKTRDGFATRKHLWQLTATDIAAIEGEDIRKVVAAQLALLGGGDPRKLFAVEANRPMFRGSRVRRVRVGRTEKCFHIGSASSGHLRWVATEENHHAALFLEGGRAGRTIVSQFEAQRRRAAGEPIVQFPSTAMPLMSLAVGETVQFEKRLYTVRSVSRDPRVSLTALDDGRTLSEIISDKKLTRLSVDQLYQRGARKVLVTPTGTVAVAND
jgi:CRISPR-associated endonuclease Csn1